MNKVIALVSGYEGFQEFAKSILALYRQVITEVKNVLFFKWKKIPSLHSYS